MTAPVHLRRVIARVGQPVCAAELAVQIVEAVVFEVDHDDVLQLLEPSWRTRRCSLVLRARPRISGGVARAGYSNPGQHQRPYNRGGFGTKPKPHRSVIRTSEPDSPVTAQEIAMEEVVLRNHFPKQTR